MLGLTQRQNRPVSHAACSATRRFSKPFAYPKKQQPPSTVVRRFAAQRAIVTGDVAALNGVRSPNSERSSIDSRYVDGNTTRALGRASSMEPCLTTFRCPAAVAGKEVCVIGSFCDWSNPIPLQQLANGDFVRSFSLPPGTYQYKFIVDGEWRNSISDVVVSDDQGCFNNQVTVAPTAEFVVDFAGPQSDAYVVGDFCGWSELFPLTWDPEAKAHKLKCSLPPGSYKYKLLVDGEWYTMPDTPKYRTDEGWECNKLIVAAPTAFTVYYATGWENAYLNIRYLAEDGTPEGEWQQILMANAPSRARPSGGYWKVGSLPVSPSRCEGATLPKAEFYITDGNGGLDKPNQDAYRLPVPGAFRLMKGRITPFPRVQAPPMMLVSDLDGTMVQDNNEGDYHMRRFTEYWENSASLARSILVYNTGRSLGQFMGLWNGKRGDLALPDVLITAVGTKVWRLEDPQGAGRSRLAAEPVWVEDMAWSRRLDDGWDLSAVRRVAEKAMQRANGAAHWLDEGTEHPHRVALSVRADKVPDVCSELKTNFLAAGVKVRLIVSGTGEYRYVDCVAFRAGKLEAMEYVRSLYGIPKERCVAAGDSGNDILMMEGSHPAIVVGNSQPELVDFALRHGSPRVIFTEGYYAAGIFEGLARHGLL